MVKKVSSQLEIQARKAIKEVNKKKAFINKYWDESRLKEIVTYGMRLRFEKAEMLYGQCKYTQDWKKIIEMSEMMLRGYDALTDEAEELGFAKLSPTTWLYEHNKTKYLVVRADNEMLIAHHTYSGDPNTIVITLSELFMMADQELLKTKEQMQKTLNTTAQIVEYEKGGTNANKTKT